MRLVKFIFFNKYFTALKVKIPASIMDFVNEVIVGMQTNLQLDIARLAEVYYQNHIEPLQKLNNLILAFVAENDSSKKLGNIKFMK